MQLLRDNLTLWTSDLQESGEKPAEEGKPADAPAEAPVSLLISPMCRH